MPIQLIDIQKYISSFPDANPFQAHIWNSYVVRLQLVRSYYLKSVGRATKAYYFVERSQHEKRIAWLMLHGWVDPIELDVGFPNLGLAISNPTSDGNHRVAAALALELPYIEASCSGDVGIIEQILWV
jgi:hypothetical protein